MSRPILLSLCLVSALAACTVGPDYRKPAPDVPLHWNAVENASGRGSSATWWTQFEDPALSGLIVAALASSPDLRTAQAKLRESRARYGVANAARYPSVTNGLSGARNESAGSGATVDSYAFGFDASWELDVFGGVRRSVEAADATVDASAESLRDTQVTLVAEVARLYADLRTQQQRLLIARQNTDSLADTDQTTRWRNQAGLVTELDVLQSRSNLEQTRARKW